MFHDICVLSGSSHDESHRLYNTANAFYGQQPLLNWLNLVSLVSLMYVCERSCKCFIRINMLHFNIWVNRNRDISDGKSWPWPCHIFLDCISEGHVLYFKTVICVCQWSSANCVQAYSWRWQRMGSGFSLVQSKCIFSASEMTCIVSSGALNSTHSLPRAAYTYATASCYGH